LRHASKKAPKLSLNLLARFFKGKSGIISFTRDKKNHAKTGSGFSDVDDFCF